MKTFRSGLAVVMGATALLTVQFSAWSQQIELSNFDNWGNTNYYATNYGLIWTNGPDGPGLLQEDVNVTLLGGTNASNLTEICSLTLADGTALYDVYIFGDGLLFDVWTGFYTVPGVSSGPAVLELRLWLGNDTNYDAAVSNGVPVADSGPFENPTGGAGAPPTIPPGLIGMPAMILQGSGEQAQFSGGNGNLTSGSATGENTTNGTGDLTSGSLAGDASGASLSGAGGSYGPMSSYNYGSNTLWLEITRLTNAVANLVVHGTVEDTVYELLSKQALTNAQWVSDGTLLGAAGQDWTPVSVPVGTLTNAMFFWARSWVDSDGGGLPDWWQLEYFGHTGVDPYADPDGDGWNNLQEYQNGTNPNSFNTPPAPQGLQVAMGPGGTNALVKWFSSYGPVTNYIVQRSFLGETNQFSSATTELTDTGTVLPSWLYDESESPQYRVQAQYVGGYSAWAGWVTPAECRAPNVQSFVGGSGQTYLAVNNLADAVILRVGIRDSDGYHTISVTNFDVPVSSFTNGLAIAPAGFAEATNNAQTYAQWITSSGVKSAWNVAGGVWPAFYFYDARQQLRENLRFLLRSATVTQPFSYFSDMTIDGNVYALSPGNMWDADFFFARPPSSAEYEYSGLHIYNYYFDDVDYQKVRPVQDNFLWRNYTFNAADVSKGTFQTGAGYSLAASLRTLQNPKYYYSGDGTEVPLPVALESTNFTWSLAFGSYYLDDLTLAEGGLWLDASNRVYLPANVRNVYGLPINSYLLNRQDGQYTNVVAGGAAVRAADGTLYFVEVAEPVLQTVDYYFASPTPYFWLTPDYPPQPGTPDFSATNSSPPLIAPVGEYYQVIGWAKQAILNGYSNKFAYLEQYFDKVYTMTNGVATTNQTGILSPYGEFFPTEPGPTALVTLPDLDTGQRGTGVVNVIKLALDVNHDGVMDLSFAGPDNTSEQRPFVFWVNNDRDDPGTGGNLDHDVSLPPNSTNTDYSFGQIRTARNLEDFARLWVCGVPTLPTNQSYSVQIGWSQIDSGTPRLRLYWSSETNGGIGYLTNVTIASQQIIDYNFPAGEITSTNSLSLPLTLFANGLPRYFLFEAGAAGKGELTLTVLQGGNTVAQTSAWLDFHDIRDLYEEVAITNVLQTWPEMVQTNLTSGFQVVSYPSADIGDAQQMTVFVHGWRMTYADYTIFSQTMFKRLYWQGYQGKFAALRWPTRSKETELFPGMDYLTYNRSEHIAFKSGTGAAAYLNNLRSRFTNSTISVCAHSMGGIVTMQTLKELATAGQRPLDNVVLMQAAVPSHCFDTNAASYQLFLNGEAEYPTPDTYRNYAAGITNALRSGGKIVNFFNPVDGALLAWEFNQVFRITNFFGYGMVRMKANSVLGYYTDGTDSILRTNAINQSIFSIGWLGYYGNGPTRSITNLHELMPFVARPRSQAVGEQASINGQIQGQELNLQTQLGFGSGESDHSGQFNRNIQEAPIWPFYFRLKTNLFSLP